MARKHRDPIPVPDDSGSRLDVVQSNSELNPATADVGEYKPGSGMGAVVVHHLVTAVLLIMVVALGIWGYLTFKDIGELTATTEKPTPFERPAVRAQVDRLHFALSVYFAIYDKYPADLEALVDEGLISTSDLEYPPGFSTILYQRVGETYQLMVERTLTKTVPAETAGNEHAADDGSAAPSTNGEADAGSEADDENEPPEKESN